MFTRRRSLPPPLPWFQSRARNCIGLSEKISFFFFFFGVARKLGHMLETWVREDLPSGDSGEDYDPEEKGSGHSMAQKPKPRTSAKATSKQKGKQRGGRCNVGKLSKLLDMPLDTLYEVSHRIISVTDDHNGVYDGPFGVCRYSLSSIQWIYYGCHRQARHFATFSQASPRNTFGKPLSITFPRPKDHPRVLRT